MKIYVGSGIKLSIIPTSEPQVHYSIIHGLNQHLHFSMSGGGQEMYFDRQYTPIDESLENIKVEQSVKGLADIQDGDYQLSILLRVPLETRVLEIENHGSIPSLPLDLFQFDEVIYFSDSDYITNFTFSEHNLAYRLKPKTKLRTCRVTLRDTAYAKINHYHIDNLVLFLSHDSKFIIENSEIGVLSGLGYDKSSIKLSGVKGAFASFECKAFSEAVLSFVNIENMRLTTHGSAKIYGCSGCEAKTIWYNTKDTSSVEKIIAIEVNGQRLDKSSTKILEYIPNILKKRPPKARDLILKNNEHYGVSQ